MDEDARFGEVAPQEWLFHFETGRLCLNFVSTLGERGHRAFDRWRRPGDLARWCVEAPLLPEPPAITEAQLSTARHLREAIYRAVVAVRAGAPPGPRRHRSHRGHRSRAVARMRRERLLGDLRRRVSSWEAEVVLDGTLREPGQEGEFSGAAASTRTLTACRRIHPTSFASVLRARSGRVGAGCSAPTPAVRATAIEPPNSTHVAILSALPPMAKANLCLRSRRSRAELGSPTQRLRRLAKCAQKGPTHAFGVAKAGMGSHSFDRFGAAFDPFA
jgi:hypothetical protein